MGKFQRDKGKRGEREACELLRTLGYKARRSSQYQGVVNESLSADIVHNIPGVRIEVKYGYNDLDLNHSAVIEWINTCKEETPEGMVWIILWRKERKKWSVIFSLDNLIVQSYEVESVIKHVIK